MARHATIDLDKAEADSAAIAADLIEIANDIDARCDALANLQPAQPAGTDDKTADRNRRFIELSLISLRLDALGLRRLAHAIPDAEYHARHRALGGLAEKIGATLGGHVQ